MHCGFLGMAGGGGGVERGFFFPLHTVKDLFPFFFLRELKERRHLFSILTKEVIFFSPSLDMDEEAPHRCGERV